MYENDIHFWLWQFSPMGIFLFTLTTCADILPQYPSSKWQVVYKRANQQVGWGENKTFMGKPPQPGETASSRYLCCYYSSYLSLIFALNTNKKSWKLNIYGQTSSPHVSRFPCCYFSSYLSLVFVMKHKQKYKIMKIKHLWINPFTQGRQVSRFPCCYLSSYLSLIFVMNTNTRS